MCFMLSTTLALCYIVNGIVNKTLIIISKNYNLIYTNIVSIRSLYTCL